MSENWSIIREEVHTYRSYVKRLPAKAAAKASYCYLLTKEEIDRLLSLAGKENLLDGIRIYLGGETVEGHLVPKVHVVACKKDGEDYNDYNVPSNLPHINTADKTIKPLAFTASSTGSTGGSSNDTGTLRPCPTLCGGSNILNS